jgi:hypothetical protein
MIIILMMEATSTPETSVNFYQTTWHYDPDASHQIMFCLTYNFQPVKQ